MSYLLIRHKVEDYARWKPLFDEHGATRQANGSRGGQLFRSATDPNELVILLEWNDIEQAHQFAPSPDLREVMKRAGVADQPDIYLLEAGEHIPA